MNNDYLWHKTKVTNIKLFEKLLKKIGLSSECEFRFMNGQECPYYSADSYTCTKKPGSYCGLWRKRCEESAAAKKKK